MKFEKALEQVKQGKAMRLPQWNSDVVIKCELPDDANSKMTAPYLYAESHYGCTPWRETFPEMFNDDWEIVDDCKTSFDQCDLVLVESLSEFSRYIDILRESNEIDTVIISKHIVYKKNKRWPVYVKALNQISTMDGFGKHINNTEMFISPISQQDNKIASRIYEWMQVINNINLIYSKYREDK